MKLLPRTALVASLLAAACGGADEASVSDPASEPGAGTASSTPPGTPDPALPGESDLIADLRADTNRDGEVRFDDPADDDGEDVWDAKHGAVFLANIDDDEESCPTDEDDVDLPKCNDAADEKVNGADDAIDLARLATRPWAKAPDGATATLTWTAGDHVRLFKVSGTTFTAIASGATLTVDELRSGAELAIEGRDIVRDPKVWDGYVDITYAVEAGDERWTDAVKMRVAPLLTYHHLSPSISTWVSSTGGTGNAAMRADLKAATAAAGLDDPKLISTSDQWTQDFFETGFMSMPAKGGAQHVIRVNIRSANATNPISTKNPLRRAGRVVFTGMRGKDTAGIQEFDPKRNGKFDTLNSFGNFETVPPYALNGQTYPLGRVLRGSTPTYYPDQKFQAMIEAQNVQPSIYIDTSWLLVGHVDETTSFVKAPATVTPRGWVLLVNDATMAKTMLETASNAGNGSVPMFVGKNWSQGSAQVTIDQVLADTDVMSASAEAAVEVEAQIATLKAEIGLTDAEIIRIPYLHMSSRGMSVAYQPGMVNGIYLNDGHFAAPNPHGPSIEGKDIFKQAMESALGPLEVTVHWVEDWDTYHRQLGEVHCGSNATRKVPDTKWWESALVANFLHRVGEELADFGIAVCGNRANLGDLFVGGDRLRILH
jgi:protein-arginine deiminase